MDDYGAPRDGVAAREFSVTADEVTCQELVELITGYLEGELATRTHGQVEEHLVMCDWCVTYVEQMDATIGLLGSLRDG